MTRWQAGVLLCSVVFILFASRLNHSVQATQDQEQATPAVEAIGSASPALRKEGVAQVRRERAELISAMAEILGDADRDRAAPGARVAAAYVLGEIRAQEAVPLLLRNIAGVQPLASHDTVTGQPEPCVSALIKIGKPAAREAVREMLDRDLTDSGLGLRVKVLVGVEGPDVAEFLLRGMAEAQEGSVKAGRIERALLALVK